MKLAVRLRLACVACAVLALAAGCTSTSADGPTSESALSITVRPSVVDPSTASPASSTPSSPTPSFIEPPSPTPSSLDPAAQEAADRSAIETVWAQFWVVVTGGVRIPDDQRQEALDQVAVDPFKADVLSEIRDSEAEGLDRYGSMIQHPYWEQPINGANTANMGDCQDASQSGVVYVESGKKKNVGSARNNIRATFVRLPDDSWRVSNVFFQVDVPC